MRAMIINQNNNHQHISKQKFYHSIFMKTIKLDVVHIILHNERKEILLQFRDKNAPVAPLVWSLFGGGIEKGETPLKAVIRETQEELEYSLQSPKLVIKRPYTEIDRSGDKFEGMVYIFTEKFREGEKIHLHEGADYGWFDIDNLTTLPNVTSDMMQLIRNLLLSL